MTDIKNQSPDSRRHFDEAMAELVAERDALISAIVNWWEAKRPCGWTAQDHAANPFVNRTSDSDAVLAQFAANKTINGNT